MRNYLTSNELKQIVTELTKVEDGKLVYDNVCDRELVKIGMVLQCLCEEVKGMKTCNDMYDWYMEQDFDLDVDVKNYYMIDGLVKEELGVDSVIRNFVESLNGKLEGFDLAKNIEQLKGVVDRDGKE